MAGKSLAETIQDALWKMKGLDIKDLNARVKGKVVTLTGVAPNAAAKARAMELFESLVETDDTINKIKVAASAGDDAEAERAASSAAAAAKALAAKAALPSAATKRRTAAASATMRIHQVKDGETLAEIAKKYYGKSSASGKIAAANKDVLPDPQRIEAGQKLLIP